MAASNGDLVTLHYICKDTDGEVCPLQGVLMSLHSPWCAGMPLSVCAAEAPWRKATVHSLAVHLLTDRRVRAISAVYTD